MKKVIMGKFSPNSTLPQSSKPSRRRLLINPPFQIRMIGYVLILALFILGVLYGSNLLFFSRFVESGRLIGLPPQHVYFQFIAEQRSSMNHLFLLVSICVISMICGFGLIISHKIAGPIHHLRTHLANLGANRTKARLRFRKGDFFPELADSYNSWLDKNAGSSIVDRSVD